jgi:hypothetical protein
MGFFDWLSNIGDWFVDTLGNIGSGVAHIFGGEAGWEKKRNEYIQKATDKWNEQQKLLNETYQKFVEDYTGEKGNALAYKIARENSGYIASKTDESNKEQARKAQQNVGVGKSQAAMSSANLSTYDQTFDENLDNQVETVSNFFKDKVAGADELKKQYDEQLKTKYNQTLSYYEQAGMADTMLEARMRDQLDNIDASTMSFLSDKRKKDIFSMDINSTIILIYIIKLLTTFKPKDYEDFVLIDQCNEFFQLWKKYHGKRSNDQK